VAINHPTTLANKTKLIVGKKCEACGKLLERKRFNGRLEDFGRFSKRRFCNAKCMGSAMVTDDPTPGTIEYRNTKLDRKAACEMCGTSEGLGTHHVDGNKQNNAESNRMTLCGSCHTKWHWQHGKRSQTAGATRSRK
jgi:hypothetical protein